MKPVQRGIKLYIHACAESGYCQAFNIYLGAESTHPTKNGATFDVVWNLVEVLCNKYYCMYFDNLYTSILLLRFLYSKGLYGCGMVRKLRKFLHPYIKDPGKKIQWGEHKIFQSKRLSNLTCTVWKDTSIVQFASCLSKPNVSSNVHRRVGRHHVQVSSPGVALIYGKYMSGVDKFDAIMTKKLYSKLGHGSRKVWRHLLWYLVNMAISNSWILYKLLQDNSLKIVIICHSELNWMNVW